MFDCSSNLWQTEGNIFPYTFDTLLIFYLVFKRLVKSIFIYFSFPFIPKTIIEGITIGDDGGHSCGFIKLELSVSCKKSCMGFGRCDDVLSCPKIQFFMLICKCCLYVFAFIFTSYPLTKNGLVAPFHVKQADTITLMNCLFVWWKRFSSGTWSFFPLK